MEWSWVSFVVGALVGAGVMWLAVVLAETASAERSGEEERWR